MKLNYNIKVKLVLCCVVCGVQPQESQGCIPFFERAYYSLTFLVTCVCGVLKHATYKEKASYITKSQESVVYNTQACHKDSFQGQVFQGQTGTYCCLDSVQAGSHRTSMPYHVQAACIQASLLQNNVRITIVCELSSDRCTQMYQEYVCYLPLSA